MKRQNGDHTSAIGTLRLLGTLRGACMVASLVVATPGMAAEPVATKTTAPTPFIAQYKAVYNDSTFDNLVSRKLERLADGTYRHSYSAEHLLYSAHEESRMELKGCEVKPLQYMSRRGNVFRNREKSIDFDWQKNLAHYDNEGRKGEFALLPDTVDPMSVFIRVACQITGNKKSFSFPETDDDKIEMREYHALGIETIDTPIGKIKTIRIERKHKNQKRQTFIWLLRENPVVVVRIRQTDTDGSIYSLDLTSWKALSAK